MPHLYIQTHSCVKCSGPLRPDVVWTGESHNTDVLYAVDEALKRCDLFLQVQTPLFTDVHEVLSWCVRAGIMYVGWYILKDVSSCCLWTYS